MAYKVKTWFILFAMNFFIYVQFKSAYTSVSDKESRFSEKKLFIYSFVTTTLTNSCNSLTNPPNNTKRRYLNPQWALNTMILRLNWLGVILLTTELESTCIIFCKTAIFYKYSSIAVYYKSTVVPKMTVFQIWSHIMYILSCAQVSMKDLYVHNIILSISVWAWLYKTNTVNCKKK